MTINDSRILYPVLLSLFKYYKMEELQNEIGAIYRGEEIFLFF